MHCKDLTYRLYSTFLHQVVYTFVISAFPLSSAEESHYSHHHQIQSTTVIEVGCDIAVKPKQDNYFLYYTAYFKEKNIFCIWYLSYKFCMHLHNKPDSIIYTKVRKNTNSEFPAKDTHFWYAYMLYVSLITQLAAFSYSKGTYQSPRGTS